MLEANKIDIRPWRVSYAAESPLGSVNDRTAGRKAKFSSSRFGETYAPFDLSPLLTNVHIWPPAVLLVVVQSLVGS